MQAPGDASTLERLLLAVLLAQVDETFGGVSAEAVRSARRCGLPGISCSAMPISLRPHAASEICARLRQSAAVLPISSVRRLTSATCEGGHSQRVCVYVSCTELLTL